MIWKRRRALVSHHAVSRHRGCRAAKSEREKAWIDLEEERAGSFVVGGELRVGESNLPKSHAS